jgi:putative glutamine amidotransferase
MEGEEDVKRPIIGITCSRTPGGRWGDYSLGQFLDYVYEAYSRSVALCGGAPLLLPVVLENEIAAALVERLDGLILAGGPDVHPRLYGEEVAPGLGPVDFDADRLQIALAKSAVEHDLPLLGICRGIQVLNVALGGTLHQDLKASPSTISHTQTADRGVASHTVSVAAGTRLHRIVRQKSIWVNSHHHQAIKDPAPGLAISATAGDGIIEAVELPEHPFALAVQWHPEGMAGHDLYAKRLFKAFVAAAEDR